MMMHVLKWCNVALYPRRSSLSHMQKYSHTYSTETPMSGVLLAASGVCLGPAAKTNRDLLFHWISQQKHRKREDSIADESVCMLVCLCLKEGEQLSGTLYKRSTPSIALN